MRLFCLKCQSVERDQALQSKIDFESIHCWRCKKKRALEFEFRLHGLIEQVLTCDNEGDFEGYKKVAKNVYKGFIQYVRWGGLNSRELAEQIEIYLGE